MKNDETIIIGAGPAGASAAIYLARFYHPVTLIDAKDKVHGRTSMATHLENFLGHTNPVSGKEFLTRIDEQLLRFPIKRVNGKVTKAIKKDDRFLITTDNDEKYNAKYLIIAVGLSDNMPEIEGLDPYYDTAIYHCLVCDWFQNSDKKIAVISNTDDGIETALEINSMHRPPALVVVPSENNITFSGEMIEKAKADNIPVYLSPLSQLEGKDGGLSSIILADNTKISIEVLFTRLGYKRFDQFLDEGSINIERNENGFIEVNFRTFESSIQNLFAIGPCNNGPDQAIIAGGEGALAAIEIHERILRDNGI